MSENEEKPYYQHDCSHCVFLGNHYAPSCQRYGDMYWCRSSSHPTLDSVIFRYGSEGSQYLSYPPPNLGSPSRTADLFNHIWYETATVRAAKKGAFDPNRKIGWEEKDTSDLTEEEYEIYWLDTEYRMSLEMGEKVLAEIYKSYDLSPNRETADLVSAFQIVNKHYATLRSNLRKEK